MFYNQPLADRFGNALAADILNSKWNHIEIAVAWVRHSGMRHLFQPFKKFLERGGLAQIVVGVDIENTSIEGLNDFLSLEENGSIETFIHHNESASTFHPKVYLLRNDAEARLIVGSNNITEAGLFINVEAGLQLDAQIADPLICDVRAALASWRDSSTGLAKRLDGTLLSDLNRLGYVFSEQELLARRKCSVNKSKSKKDAQTPPLFKMQRFTAPPVRRSATNGTAVPGTVLLMRVRRASETVRRTQIQIPIKVIRSNFFKNIDSLISAHDGRIHPLIKASARGGLNTIKIEIPEIEPMNDPVLRLERTVSSITYQTYDANSILGKPIQQTLLNGFAISPPLTFHSIKKQEKATWWRFI